MADAICWLFDEAVDMISTARKFSNFGFQSIFVTWVKIDEILVN